ncbi:MAG: PEP-CTERM sorting domain-containing protein [Desulfobacteraceae bacterium]|nr:PEP-CTERM sorting domain-containing protein [Desulfobacteraceae bacterium]MBC2756522.1 PEP-CTERM sorting domain-containing protein [Desulfobacteraceae bacterium]
MDILLIRKHTYGLLFLKIHQVFQICLILFFIPIFYSFAGAVSYSPVAGQEGSIAIHMDNPVLIGWANGYENYEIGTDVDEVWQTPEYALGKAIGTSYDIVSLGCGGSITMIFDPPIENGEGWDFAVFENSFNDYSLELSYVEVSSNGIDFVRFDNISLTPDPVSGYGSLDTTLINGFAGKFRQGYGTPFDLSDISEKPEVQSNIVDISRITHVRIVDIIGDGSFFDSESNVIYDPYPTVNSAGFDLDAIGVSNGAPYPEGGITEGPSPLPPEQEGEAGFGGQSGCFINTMF